MNAGLSLVSTRVLRENSVSVETAAGSRARRTAARRSLSPVKRLRQSVLKRSKIFYPFFVARAFRKPTNYNPTVSPLFVSINLTYIKLLGRGAWRRVSHLNHSSGGDGEQYKRHVMGQQQLTVICFSFGRKPSASRSQILSSMRLRLSNPVDMRSWKGRKGAVSRVSGYGIIFSSSPNATLTSELSALIS